MPAGSGRGRITTSRRSRMGIGEVVRILRADFPDVTISKIRFLETAGLVEPERSSSGYRKFSAADLDRLRYILSVQRDQYLPLKVIHEHLEAIERGLEPPTASGQPPQVPAAIGRVEPNGADGLAPSDLRVSRAELLAHAALTDAQLDEALAYGLISSRPGSEYFDGVAVLAASAVAKLADFGLEARHLRVVKQAADREIGLIEQVVEPIARRRDEDAGKRAEQLGAELSASILRLHAVLVRGGPMRADKRGSGSSPDE